MLRRRTPSRGRTRMLRRRTPSRGRTRMLRRRTPSRNALQCGRGRRDILRQRGFGLRKGRPGDGNDRRSPAVGGQRAGGHRQYVRCRTDRVRCTTGALVRTSARWGYLGAGPGRGQGIFPDGAYQHSVEGLIFFRPLKRAGKQKGRSHVAPPLLLARTPLPHQSFWYSMRLW